MVHAVLVLLAWHPDLVVPTVTLHVAAVGVWKYRRRPRAPAPHPCVRASMAEAPDREELDEEFDTIPSARPPEVVRARYDRARMVGARLQQMVGDVATQAERLQALMSVARPARHGDVRCAARPRGHGAVHGADLLPPAPGAKLQYNYQVSMHPLKNAKNSNKI